MIRKLYFASLIILFAHQKVNCAMKKSWKSAANFDSDVPKFTPFLAEGTFVSKAETDLLETKTEASQTTETQTSPSPSSETLINRLSSKIRAPSKHIANVYSLITKDANKKENSFDFPDGQPEIPQKIYSEAQHEADRNQIDISQILHDLTEEADKENENHDSSSNDVDPEDDIEVHENESTNSTQYKVGSLMNVTVVNGVSDDSLVNVNLDKNTLKQIFTGSCSRSICETFTADDKLMNFVFSPQMNSRPGQEKQSLGASRSLVYFAISDSISSRSIHGHDDQTLPNEILVCWKNCDPLVDAWSFEKPSKRLVHEVNATLTVQSLQRLPVAFPRATHREQL